MITDLETTTLSAFTSESNDWDMSQVVSSGAPRTFTIPPNSCDLAQDIVFGGPNILGSAGQSTSGKYYQTTYASMLLLGYRVGVQFDFWVFSNADISTVYLKVQINEDDAISGAQTITQLGSTCTNLNYNQPSSGIMVNYVRKYRYVGWFSASTLGFGTAIKLQIISQSPYPSSHYSIGVRNLKIYRTDPVTIVPANFPCSKNFYWNTNDCYPCHSSCEACSGPSSTQCTVCRDAYFDYRDGSGTCPSDCDPPYDQSVISGKKFCDPVCPTDFYWEHNNSCTLTCDYPFTPSTHPGTTLKTCISGCTAAQFLYPNQSCFATCLSPLKSTIESTFKLCENPCLTQKSGRLSTAKPKILLALTRNNYKFFPKIQVEYKQSA